MSNTIKEFRLKKGRIILDYVRRFSSTEKFLFGSLIIIAFISMVMMVSSINKYFLVEIPATGGDLNEGLIGLPRTVNPIIAVTDTDKDISALVYSGLTRYENGSFIPDIAESYDISEDGLIYDFKLRDDVFFHDGVQLTSEDIAFTIQKIQDPGLLSPRKSDWINITTKVISPTQIQIILKQAYSPFIANTTIGIIPKHIWSQVKNDQFIFSDFNIRPIGTGPYMFADIKRDSGGIPTEYSLKVWKKYHGSLPNIENIIFSFFSDEERALSAIDNGDIDSLPSISAGPATKLASSIAQNYRIVSAPLSRVFGVFFNQNHNPALADKTVRKALDMSIDRELLIQAVLAGYGTPIVGPIPSLNIATSTTDISTSTSSSTISDLTDIDPRIVSAQALLEKQGWKKGTDGIYTKKPAKGDTLRLSFELHTSDTPDLKQTADILQKTWNSLGAEVSIKVFESGDLYQNIIRTRTYDALLFGEQIGRDRDLYAFWHSSQRTAPGLNISMYTNSTADKLIETMRSSTDEAKRTEAYIAFEKIIREDIPAVFLYMPHFIYAIPKDLNIGEMTSLNTPTDRWNTILDWYIKKESVWKIFNK